MFSKLKETAVRTLGLQYSYPSVKRELSNFAKKYVETSNFSEKIDIIIPTYNRFRETKRTLDHLYKTTKVPFNLIIVDNGSTDETLNYFKSLNKPNLKIIYLQSNPGAAAARLTGLNESKSKYVAFLDNDIITMPYYFENLITTLETNADVIGVQSKVILPNKLIQINRPTFEVDGKWILFSDKDSTKYYNNETSLIQEQCKWIPIGATLWRREVFDAYSFDKAMGTSYEDNDLSYTLFKAGYKFMNCPKAVCLHVNSDFAPEGSKNQQYTKARFGFDNVRNSAKHFYQKHRLFFVFGDTEAYCKHIGFADSKEYQKFITT